MRLSVMQGGSLAFNHSHRFPLVPAMAFEHGSIFCKHEVRLGTGTIIDFLPDTQCLNPLILLHKDLSFRHLDLGRLELRAHSRGTVQLFCVISMFPLFPSFNVSFLLLDPIYIYLDVNIKSTETKH